VSAPVRAPVRLGVVGCGAFGRFALQAVAGSPLVTLVALADPREECRLEAARVWHQAVSTPDLGNDAPTSRTNDPVSPQQRTDVRLYEEGAKVCQDPGVDLVWILAPPYLHYPLARMALEHRKGVFLEKPGAIRPGEMEELGALADSRGAPASVDFVLRRTPLATLVSRIVNTGVVGPAERVVLENVAHDERLPEGHWFWNPVLSGGIFVEHGVHFFDLANWWFGVGEVKGALGLRRTRWKDAPVDRVLCTCLHGASASPVLATYYHSFTTVERFERASWHLVLHRGFLDVEGWIPTAIRGEVLVTDQEAQWLKWRLGCALDALDQPQPDRDPAWGGQDAPEGTGGRPLRYRARLLVENPDRTAVYRQAIRAGLEDVAACLIESGRQPAVTLEDARRALEMAYAATRSAESA